MTDPVTRPRWQPVLVLVASLAPLAWLPVMAAGKGAPAGKAAPAARPAGDDPVVATIGRQAVRLSQLEARAAVALAKHDGEATLAQLRQEESAARARHAVLGKALGDWLDEQALAAEAKAQGSTPEALLGAVTATPVTEQEQADFYASRRGEGDPPWSQAQAQLGPRVRQYLAGQHQQQAQRDYLDGLRAKHGLASSLAPYRAPMPTGGPTKGADKARVTVVEFGDYQCPHCARAQSVVRELLARHADDVRIEFHQLPLEGIHPDARGAAIAAVCARGQGRFWEYHEALFADQANLGSTRLQSEALAQGLDGKRFAACLESAAAAAAVDADTRAGAAAGVAGTPAFFVNGRPVTTDVAELEKVVGEELAARR